MRLKSWQSANQSLDFYLNRKLYNDANIFMWGVKEMSPSTWTQSDYVILDGSQIPQDQWCGRNLNKPGNLEKKWRILTVLKSWTSEMFSLNLQIFLPDFMFWFWIYLFITMGVFFALFKGIIEEHPPRRVEQGITWECKLPNLDTDNVLNWPFRFHLASLTGSHGCL